MVFRWPCDLCSLVSTGWLPDDTVTEIWTNDSDYLTVHRESSLPFSEFNRLSNQLAEHLRSASPTLVAIVYTPSIYTAVAVHGVLHSTSAFLPLSGHDRLTEILDLFGAVICFCDEPELSEECFSRVQDKPFNVYIRIDQKSHQLPKQNGLAYCITTSGSTGSPKLILVGHSCVSANVVDLANRLPLADDNSGIPGVFITSPLTFDASIVQIYVGLATHRRIIFPSESIILGMEGKLLEQIIISSGVDTWQCTPSIFSRLPAPPSTAELRTLWIFLGGEPCSPERLPHWTRKKWKFYFLYGLTEVSAWSSIVDADAVMSEEPPRSGTTPIGSPMLQSQVTLKDVDETSGIGQVFIGRSHGGYTIVEEPFSKASLFSALGRLHEGGLIPTGDYAISVPSSRHSPLWFLGRRDRLVKIHGMKCYLECLETEILQILNSRFQAINCRCEAPPLRVYIQVENQPSSNELNDLKQWLLQLTSFPIPPNNVIFSDKPLRLNANGKVASRSINHICLSSIGSSNSDISNFTFQQLGGTSLKAMFLMETLTEDYPTLSSRKAVLLSTLFSKPFSEFMRLVETFVCETSTEVTKTEPPPHKAKRRRVCVNAKAGLIWSVVLGKCVDASPIVDSGSLFIGSHSGVFKRLDIDTGSEIWSRNVESRIEATACLIDELVVFGTLDGQLYALQVKDGEVVWTVDAGGAVKTAPTRVPGSSRLLIGSHGRRLLAIGKSGCIEWSESLDQSPIVAPVTLDAKAEFAFVGTLGGGLHRIVIKTGSRDWSVDMLGPVFGAPALQAELHQVVVASADGGVHCLSEFNGVRLWNVTLTPRGGFFSPPIPLNSLQLPLLLLANQSGHLHAIESANGATAWTVDCGTKMLESATRTVFPTTPRVIQQTGLMLFARTDGCLFICNDLRNTSPSPQLVYRLPSETFSAPLALQLKPGTLAIFIGCRNDTINRLDVNLRSENHAEET
ncbi:hypothetical protein Aperf_G00000132752 [Anoplocephala perfoliata]